MRRQEECGLCVAPFRGRLGQPSLPLSPLSLLPDSLRSSLFLFHSLLPIFHPPSAAAPLLPVRNFQSIPFSLSFSNCLFLSFSQHTIKHSFVFVWLGRETSDQNGSEGRSRSTRPALRENLLCNPSDP